MNTRPYNFRLRWLFTLLGALAVLFAIVGLAMRAGPDRIPEAVLLNQVSCVRVGMSVDEITREFGFAPSASWLDENGSGYVCWRFEVSDVPYADSRARYFAKLENRTMLSAHFFYPLESFGGGMAF